ncbi:MAG: DUF3465 domain-containing protein [Oscillospiraceae bacterium]|jgi:hypothetical protein|nr:DUF3465 domain-containing protein [Oscillospiraceae bacterium]
MAKRKSVLSYLSPIAIVLILVVLYIAKGGTFRNWFGEEEAGTSAAAPPPSSAAAPESDVRFPTDGGAAEIARLFAQKKSDVQVAGYGTVQRILADDNDGARHQRFILEMSDGHTLLVAHNIDQAPRLAGLAVGDTVAFYGEYYYDAQGGGVHWTHRSDTASHVGGYLEWDGKRYE